MKPPHPRTPSPPATRTTPAGRTLRALGAVVLALAGPASSAAFADTGAKPSAARPEITDRGPPQSGLKVPGTIVKIVRWFDAAGGQLEAVFSTKDHKGGRALRVDLALGTGRTWKTLRTVTDRIDRCAFDVVVDFVPASIQVTDLDGDGRAELTFAYTTACTSDVSPSTLKLLVLERETKYILRGTTRIGEDGGQFTPTPAAAKWPRPFLDHATRVWGTIASA